MRCLECSRKSAGAAAHWRAYLREDPEDEEDGVVEVAVYCRDCAEREFGPMTARRLDRSDSEVLIDLGSQGGEPIPPAPARLLSCAFLTDPTFSPPPSVWIWHGSSTAPGR